MKLALSFPLLTLLVVSGCETRASGRAAAQRDSAPYGTPWIVCPYFNGLNRVHVFKSRDQLVVIPDAEHGTNAHISKYDVSGHRPEIRTEGSVETTIYRGVELLTGAVAELAHVPFKQATVTLTRRTIGHRQVVTHVAHTSWYARLDEGDRELEYAEGRYACVFPGSSALVEAIPDGKTLSCKRPLGQFMTIARTGDHLRVIFRASEPDQSPSVDLDLKGSRPTIRTNNGMVTTKYSGVQVLTGRNLELAHGHDLEATVLVTTVGEAENITPVRVEIRSWNRNTEDDEETLDLSVSEDDCFN